MSQYLPQIRIRTGEQVGNEIWVRFPDLSGAEKSYFLADEAAAQTTLSVNGTNFGTDQYVVLGVPGTENCEIAKTHTSTPSTSTTITTGATTFAHSRGEPVMAIPYNQIELYSSSDGSSYSLLSTVSIRPDAVETYIPHAAGTTTTYYKARFKNSTDTTYSGYSSGIIVTGGADNSVESIIRRAMRSMDQEIGGKFTWSFLIETLNEARRVLDQDPRVRRWSFRQKFAQDIGAITEGQYSVSVPSDLRDPNTPKNIISVRIGKLNYHLPYVDWQRLREFYRNVAHTTVASAITADDATITLTDTGDFDESGNVVISAQTAGDGIDTVAYTGNTEASNQLTGVTGDLDHSVGDDVWQNATFGSPTCYSIHGGKLYFDVPFEDALSSENIYMDYYATMTAVANQGDTLDEPFYDLFLPYLRWKIRYVKAGGSIKRKEDPDWEEWETGKLAVISQELNGQAVNFSPDDGSYPL